MIKPKNTASATVPPAPIKKLVPLSAPTIAKPKAGGAKGGRAVSQRAYDCADDQFTRVLHALRHGSWRDV